MADLYDWADVAAICVMYRNCPASPVRDLVGRLLRAPKHYCSDLEREHVTIAAALREAYEAGCRSVYPVPSCPECGISGACIEEDGICSECGWRVPGVEQFEDS